LFTKLPALKKFSPEKSAASTLQIDYYMSVSLIAL